MTISYKSVAIMAAAVGLCLTCVPTSASATSLPTSQPGCYGDYTYCHDYDRDRGGIKVRAHVGEILCVKVDALTDRRLADARTLAPCPSRHYPAYRSCDQARDSGARDIPREDRRYRDRLDEDRDGIACESPSGNPRTNPRTGSDGCSSSCSGNANPPVVVTNPPADTSKECCVQEVPVEYIPDDSVQEVPVREAPRPQPVISDLPVAG